MITPLQVDGDGRDIRVIHVIPYISHGFLARVVVLTTLKILIAVLVIVGLAAANRKRNVTSIALIVARDWRRVSRMDEKQVKPFWSGSSYLDWRWRNCDRCKKDVEYVDGGYIPHCDIENAISMGAITGTIPLSIYKRMGLPDSYSCPEFELAESEE